jgi:aminobenzoyl-glutamate transport protein
MSPSASTPPSGPGPAARRRLSLLDRVELIGNKLPEPAVLFAILAGLVIAISAAGAWWGWSVQPVILKAEYHEKLDASGAPIVGADGKPLLVPNVGEDGRPVVRLEPSGDPLTPRNLLTSDGIYWMLSSMIRNFTGLPALGLVFVAMLGIGLAEKFGLFGAFMRWMALATPRSLLTPMVVFVGANSSIASDAGYIILPPLAAALFAAMGRPPIAGLAAAFAGVAGGFGGGIFPTAADGFLAGTATQAAQVLDPSYHTVVATHNLYFKAASTVVIMLAGWFVTDRIIEPRLRRQGGPSAADEATIASMGLSHDEKRGLLWAGAVMLAVLAVFAAMVLIPAWPLHGVGQPTLATGAPAPGERAGDRWSQVIVPLIFFLFLLPGMAFAIRTGQLRGQRDFIDGIYHGIRTIVPVLAIAFFMGQFVNYFQYTGLDRMLAYAGGSLLVQADLPIPLLLVLFILLVVAGDFAISGMLSKFGVLAPIFIPMFMMAGISAELTTAAYRIGDSVVNIITPLNSYLLIILAVLQKYRSDAGLGSLIALMAPYSAVFFVVWTGFLLLWYFSGFPLGTDAPLRYVPSP